MLKITSFFHYITSILVKLLDGKILDILEFEWPPSWQKETILQYFDVISFTILEFVDFFGRLEMFQGFEQVPECT